MRDERDVVLVTVDCWRYDALQHMPGLREWIDEGAVRRGEAICAAPATRGAFAALFAGRYYPSAYAGFDELESGVETLPAVLRRAGYATGGFVGSNPFLNAFADEFDGFWNDGLAADEGDGIGARIRDVASRLGHVARYLRCRGRVPAAGVARRARQWYETVDGPRFLSMHLMDPHVPFLPGLRRGLRAGLPAVYRSHYRFDRDPEALTPEDRETLQKCYRLSLEYLDGQFERLLEFVDDDAVVVVTGDHGEEFDHGGFGHARLYDETVRVPLLTKGVDAVGDGDVMRQIDVAPTLASAVGASAPDRWDGRTFEDRYRDAFALNHSPKLGNLYAGIRTESRKLLWVADDRSRRVVNREAYDLDADPAEEVDVYADREWSDLEGKLDSFLDRVGGWTALLERSPEGAGEEVENRLEALGYVT